MKKTTLILAGLTTLTFYNEPLMAAENLTQAFTEGDASLSFRYRFEFVDQDNFDRNANASTIKTRLNYKTKAYKGFSFFVELDNVTEVIGDNYNSGAGTTPDRGQFPVVADPTGSELNQAWVNFNFSDHSFKLGRQRIVLDNQRFVGGVAWRQNEQTFDAASFNFKLGTSKLFLSYVDNVNRIFGGDVAAGDHDNQSYLVNWSNKWQDRHKLVAYYYNIDNENVAAFSTQTMGVSFDTFWQLDNSKATLRLEFAEQSDAANNPVNYTANYWRVDGGLKFKNINFTLGHEVLEGSATQSGASFRTPLATLHAFNGWSDQFLATPATGLKDTFVGIGWGYNQFKWLVKYHNFSSESTNQDYGSELNASVVMNYSKNTSFLLKYAQYESDGFSIDTQKIWFMSTVKF